MDNSNQMIIYRMDDRLYQLPTAIERLKKERGEEFLYTTCGIRIRLDEVIAVNGITF